MRINSRSQTVLLVRRLTVSAEQSRMVLVRTCAPTDERGKGTMATSLGYLCATCGTLSVKILVSPLDKGLAAGVALLRWNPLDLTGKAQGLHTARPIVKDRASLPGLLR